ncbi:TPA: hypothetical protein R2K51_005662, partial [Raoultella ornithinolytica]|nr:hypothetical protein [Raoultella ornithinolytica]
LLQRISSGDAVVGIDFGNLIVRELAAFRLAAMDSEPVGMFRKLAVGYTPSYHEDAVPLYRHAQPAPVVSEDLYKLANHIASSKSGLPDEWLDWAEELETDIRRAAVLQAGNSPVQSESRCSTKAAPALDSLPKTAVSRCGNSPVIPDGWTGNDKANAALMMLDRIETVDPVDDDRIDGIKRIVRELAAGPQEVK